MPDQSTEFETVEEVEYHCQIGEGIQKKLNDLQMRRAELRKQFGLKLKERQASKFTLVSIMPMTKSKLRR